jgi:hypothetical protein
MLLLIDITQETSTATYVKAKFSTGRFTTETPIHGVCNTSQVRALGNVVASSTGPHQDVVCEMPGDPMRILFGSGQRPAQQGNVLVVPRVPVRDGGPIGNPRDLVPVCRNVHNDSVSVTR